jgi:hypothetical protein
MPSPFTRKEFPKTLSRQRWSLTLKVGLDINEILGLGASATSSVAGLSQIIDNNLQTFGSVDSLEIIQSKTVHERLALGPNSAQPFQVTPLNTLTQVKLNRIQLKQMENAQQVFSFFPNNLLHQQIPFIMEAIDPGDGVNPDTRVTHYFFSCWFTDSNVKYEVTSKEDQRLIHSATVHVGRTLTLDSSLQGNPVVSAAGDLLQGLLVGSGPTSLLSDTISFI